VYSTDAYSNNDPHSVKIGYALDGYLIYGRYTASGQPGIDVDLDLCGGHEHDSLGYHYHPSVSCLQFAQGIPLAQTDRIV